MPMLGKRKEPSKPLTYPEGKRERERERVRGQERERGKRAGREREKGRRKKGGGGGVSESRCWLCDKMNLLDNTGPLCNYLMQN